MKFCLLSSIFLSAVSAASLVDNLAGELAGYDLVLVPKESRYQKLRISKQKDSAIKPFADPVFGSDEPWHDVFDELTKTLVCVCEQVIRTRGVPEGENVCATKYCLAAAKDPEEYECDLGDSEDFTNAGQLEKCVVDARPECYVYFPDLSDRNKTLEYFKAIGRCMPPILPTTTTTTTATPLKKTSKGKQRSNGAYDMW